MPSPGPSRRFSVVGVVRLGRGVVRLAAMAAVSLPAIPSPGMSTTIHVPADQPTIQAGIDAAAAGDTVLVACGTYLESEIRLTSDVVLRSETGAPDCVTVDAQREGRVLFAESVTAAVVQGLTLTGGYNEAGASLAPGSLRNDPPATTDLGGGAGAYLARSEITFSECVFEANDASIHGGGIRCEGGETTFRDCVFSTNRAGHQGGGVYLGPQTRAQFLRCLLEGNEARQGAGMFTARTDAFFADQCMFRENAATRDGGAFAGSVPTGGFQDCTFWANAAGRRGGAVAVFGQAATFTGCTFASNDAPRAGAVLAHTATITMTRSIVAFHGGSEPLRCEYGTLDLSCCDVFGNAGGDWVDCVADQGGVSGNFSADPLFCDAAAGDLGLASLSPCLPANNTCNALIGAHGPACQAEGVILLTDPPSLLLLADGEEVVSPHSALWEPGSVHEIGTTTPQEPNEDRRLEFAGWSDGGAIIHDIVVPPGVTTYTAFFDEYYLLTMSSTGSGMIRPSSDWYAEGTIVEIEAVPDSGWTFVGWVGTGNGSYTGPDSLATVTMHEPVTQAAHFMQVLHRVTMIARPGGSVFPPTGDYPENSQLQIVATPDPGYSFAGWVGEGDGSYSGPDSSASITVVGPIRQTAFFEAILHPVTMIAGPGGSVSPPSGDYPEHAEIEITATPDSGYQFVEWTGEGPGSYSGTDATAVITVLGPITQTATFAEQVFHPVTMIAGPGGSVTPPSGDYPENAQVAINATPNPGYRFVEWTGDGSGSYSGTDSSAVITVLGPITQTATFAEQVFHPVTMIAEPGGSVTPPSGDYPEHAEIVITATADSGWEFSGWIGEGPGSYTGPEPIAVITVSGPITQTASFDEQVFDVTITTRPPGKNMVVDGMQYVSPATFGWGEGSTHDVEVDSLDVIEAGSRDRFTEWNDDVRSAMRTIVADASGTYTAQYAREHLLTFHDPPEGQSLPGSGWLPEGSEVLIRAIPFPGHHVFESWSGTGAGSYTGPDNPATISMVGPIEETPTFRPVGYDFTISASASDPHVNTDQPSGTLRELYFWLACSDVGISAFEGDLVTDFDVQAFVPAPYVFNVGTPTSLLLAIGGCPGQEGTPFLIGHWTVVDSGGDACLGPSSSGILGAVDCATSPVLIESPDVVGFSSSGAQPCVLEGNGCQVGASRLVDVASATTQGASRTAAALVDAFEGARPNPFSGTTQITFSMPQAGDARVAIFDVSGRLVRHLLDGPTPAGRHELEWNGRNTRGRRMPAGVYFVQLLASGEARARKVVLLGD